MTGFRTFEIVRPQLGNGRPKAPLVDIALVRPVKKAPPPKVWTQPKVEDDGFIPPKALRPEDFEEPSAFPMRRLIALVAGVSWVSQSEITSHRRHAVAVKARQIVFWLAKKFTALSLPQIARRVGDRDHSTVLFAVRKVQAIIDRLNIKVTSCPVEMAEALWSADWSAGS